MTRVFNWFNWTLFAIRPLLKLLGPVLEGSFWVTPGRQEVFHGWHCSPVVYFDIWSSGSTYPHDLLHFLPRPFSYLLAYLHICCCKTFPRKTAVKLLLRWITTAEFFLKNHFIFALVLKKFFLIGYALLFSRIPEYGIFCFILKNSGTTRELSCFRVVPTYSNPFSPEPYLPMGASLLAQLVKNPPAIWETWVWSLGWEDPLEKGKATHSSILAWRIPRTVYRKELDTTEWLSLIANWLNK